MTDRGLPSVDGPPACPFIAFEDERDERASSPDHRHRCYAEVRPRRARSRTRRRTASRAPSRSARRSRTGLGARPRRPAAPAPRIERRGRDRRERRRAGGHRPSPEVRPEGTTSGCWSTSGATTDGRRRRAMRATVDGPRGADEWSSHDRRRAAHPRNPPRDWAAPPPWASGSRAGVVRAARPPRRSVGPGFPGQPRPAAAPGAGLAGSAADRLASGQPVGTSRPRRRRTSWPAWSPNPRAQRYRPPARSIARRPATTRRRPPRADARP